MFNALKQKILKKMSGVPLSKNGLPFNFEGLEQGNLLMEKKMGADAVQIWRDGIQSIEAESITVSRDKGYGVLDLSGDPIIDAALELGRRKFSVDFIKKNIFHASKRDTLRACHIDLQDPENNPIRKLALHPKILKPISEYLGTVPVLATAHTWLSPNNQNFEATASQLFHFDREDRRQIKCFIPIEAITEDCGPLTLIPAAESLKFFQWHVKNGGDATFKQRFSDERVHACYGAEHEVQMTGAPGLVAMVDTSSCLHYGSRNGLKHKHHFMLQYYTPFCPKNDGRLSAPSSRNVNDLVMNLVDNDQVQVNSYV